MSSATLRRLSRPEWISSAVRYADYSYRQTWAYSEAVAAMRRAESHAVEICLEGAGIGLASVRVKRIPGVGGGVAYISGGPLTEEGGFDAERFDECVAALEAEFVHRMGCTLRIVLPVRPAATWSQMQAVLEARQYGPAEQATTYETFLLALENDVDALRAGLNGKWRNHLKRGEEAGLRIVCGDEPRFFDEFVGIYAEVRDTKGFHTDVDAEFLCAVQRDAEPTERNFATLAYAGDDLAAGAIWGIHGDTCVSILAAAGPHGRDTRAAYVLQWEAVLESCRRDLRLFDLGGIDKEGNPGVYKFKRGLGGEEVAAPGPFELASHSFRGRLGRLAETVYRKTKGG